MLDQEDIYAALNEVIDPELGIGFVELGLIYAVECDEENNVTITYSLTTPGCPIAGVVDEMLRDALYDLEGIGEVTPTLTFSPPWTMEMMSEDARFDLGLI